jgi:hypothetical protein
MPELWARIDVFPNAKYAYRDNQIEFVNFCLARSKECSLSVSFIRHQPFGRNIWPSLSSCLNLNATGGKLLRLMTPIASEQLADFFPIKGSLPFLRNQVPL